MRFFSTILLCLLFLGACQPKSSDTTASRSTNQTDSTASSAASKLLKQLSPSARQAFNAGMQAQCACIQRHQAEVDSLMATLEPLSEGLAMGTIRDAGQAGMVYIHAMQKAQRFDACLAEMEGSDNKQELIAAEKELDQFFAGLNEQQQLDLLLDLYSEIAREACPEGARIINFLQQLQQQIMRLQAG